MMLRVRALALALILSMLPAAAFAGPWILPPGDWYSEVRGTFFNADSFRDTSGTRNPLANGGIHEQRTLLAYNEFGWKDHVSVILAVPFTSVTRRFGDDSFQRTETGFGDMMFGARYAITSGATAWSIEALLKAPMGYNRNLFPRLGLGQHDLSGVLQYGTHVGSNAFITLAAGYNYRTEDPADQMAAQASLGWWWGESLLLGGRYHGAMSAGSGTTTADEITEHIVGPVLVYRVDDHIDLSLGSFHTASAENALHADRVYVSLTFKESSLNRLQGFLGNKQRPQ